MSSAPDEVFMYEATGGTGVNMARFSAKKIYIGSYYRKCVLRRLTWPDKDTNLPNLLTFCKQTEGNQYSMMSKFSIQQSVIKSGANSQQAIEEGRKFFCSELIAKCYKECNISPPSTTHSSSINPSDFAERAKNPFPLVENAKLGPEMCIVTETMFNNQQEQLTRHSA